MNIFVTGGAGYIGSICAEALLDAGHQVTVYDNLSEGHRSAVDARARFVLGRPEEPDNILHAVKEAQPEAIMHFAANALVGESMTNPGKYFRNNVANGLKLLDAAVECGVKKFVFSSTCATYGPPDRVADDRGFAAAPHQSLRRIEVDVREDTPVVSAKFTAWSSLPSVTSMPPARASGSASIIASSRISSRTCCR